MPEPFIDFCWLGFFEQLKRINFSILNVKGDVAIWYSIWTMLLQIWGSIPHVSKSFTFSHVLIFIKGRRGPPLPPFPFYLFLQQLRPLLFALQGAVPWSPPLHLLFSMIVFLVLFVLNKLFFFSSWICSCERSTRRML